MQRIMIRRIWKSDSTVNTMGIQAAVLNVLSNVPSVARDETPDSRAVRIRGALLRGEVMETPLAVFSLR